MSAKCIGASDFWIDVGKSRYRSLSQVEIVSGIARYLTVGDVGYTEGNEKDFPLKSRRLAIGLFVALSLACMFGVLTLWMIHSQMFYSSPENVSMFLINYTPEHVIEHFREDESSQMSRQIGGGSPHAEQPHSDEAETMERSRTVDPAGVAPAERRSEQKSVRDSGIGGVRTALIKISATL
jgi:hypothetical protein